MTNGKPPLTYLSSPLLLLLRDLLPVIGPENPAAALPDSWNCPAPTADYAGHGPSIAGARMGKVLRDVMILLLGIGVFVGACVLALRKNPDATSVAVPLPSASGSTVAGSAGGSRAGAATGSAAAASADHGHLLYACTKGESVTYMDRPCPAGAQSKMMLVEDPNLYTPTAEPAGNPAEAWPARTAAAGESAAPIDARRAAGQPDTYGPSAPGGECRIIEAQIRSIDERGRQGYSGDEGSRLNDQRQRLREQYHALNCSER